MTAAGRWLVVALLLLAHFALHPLWSRWPVGLDLVAGGLFLGSLLLPWGRAAAFGGLIGLLEASISLGPLGPVILLFSLVGCLASWLRHLIYSDSSRFTAIFLFLGVWVLRIALTALVGGELSFASVLVYTPASAALTTAVCWVAERLVSGVVA
ncbi:hypothetical protein [Candidatus Palauibacter sp.]|uniref:hypothetical protein n=1 Tax=Candidatus Palauibacter sp. TaxID=3101350 RepID=UPI003AF2BAA0